MIKIAFILLCVYSVLINPVTAVAKNSLKQTYIGSLEVHQLMKNNFLAPRVLSIYYGGGIRKFITIRGCIKSKDGDMIKFWHLVGQTGTKNITCVLKGLEKAIEVVTDKSPFTSKDNELLITKDVTCRVIYPIIRVIKIKDNTKIIALHIEHTMSDDNWYWFLLTNKQALMLLNYIRKANNYSGS